MNLLRCAVKRILKGGGDLRGNFVKHRVVLSNTARVNIRAGHHTLRGTVNNAHHRNKTFLTEHTAVFQIVLGDCAHGTAVHVQVLAGHLAHNAGHPILHIDHSAGFAQQHVLRRNAGLLGQLAVSDQVAYLPVYRHHILGFEDVVAVQQLPRGSMPRNVHLRVTLMHHVRPQLQQGVNNTVHTGLVPRDEGGSEHNRIAWLNLHLMVTICHTGQGSHRLTLRAGAHHHNLVGTVLVYLFQVHQDTLGNLQITKLLGDRHIPNHRAAHQHHLTAALGSSIQNLLHTVHMRRERCHNNTPGCVPEHVGNNGANILLGRGEPGHLGIGGVRQEQVNAFFTQFSEVAQIGDAPIQRQLIHLKVAGVQHGASTGANKDRKGIRDRVIHRNKFALIRTETLHLVFFHRQRVRLNAVLGKFRLHKGQGQLRADEGNIRAFFQQVRYCTDMVFMPVSEHHGHHVVDAPHHVTQIGQDQINTGL